MKKIQTRFGEVEYSPEQVLHFPQGLIGFEDLRDFIVMPNEKQGPLFWIQSVEDPEVAFVLTDPTNFFLDYRVVPEKAELQKLAMAEGDDCFALSVVTVHPDRQITLNLAAPVLFAPASNRAMQVILEKTHYQTRTPLPTA
ncbi:flagellar assembly factor FliW [Desulfuromonas versatilis]|uniref:Flagellar assembly factor FliW n=1 Tax=Desulfuromonas versatilis TaxID=2802975 RepID=A0ABN6E2X5_9BACT|nr:flagellar assembly protein FliW [Desulfuromonas versatilis]BCR06602.1 flagellar assembly factor FliW [Desulfuromonas versatilis]